MENIKHMIEIFREKRYKIISDRMITVDSHTVKEQTKKGRKILTCDCDNSSTFAHINMCRHKLFYLYLPLLELFEKKVKRLINYYENGESVAKEDEKQLYGIMADDLKGLLDLK